MSSVERDFRRNLTRCVREVVHASPEMRAEWQRRHPKRPWWRVGARILIWIIFAVLGVPMAIVMFTSIASFALLFPHVYRLYGGTDAVLIPTPDYALVPMTLAVSAMVAFVAALGSSVLGPGNEMRRLAYFPIPDRQHLWRVLRKLTALAAVLTGCLAPAFLAIVVFEHLSLSQIAGIVLCVMLQLGHCLALVVALSPQVRHYSWQQAVLIFSSILLVIATLLTNGLSEHLWPHWHTLAELVLATPIGWPHAAIAYGVIGGQYLAWLYLLPLPIATAAALWWLRRGYGIREVLIGSTANVAIVYEYGLANSDVAVVSRLLAPVPQMPVTSVTGAFKAANSAVTADQVRKRLLAGESLAPLDWSRLGAIERFVARHLTDKQKSILELLYDRRPCWTRAWFLSWIMGLAPIALLLVTRLAEPPPGESKPDLTMTLWLLTLPFAEVMSRVRWSDFFPPHVRKQPFVCHPIFPMDRAETMRAVRRMFWLRLLLWLPQFAIAAAVVSAGRSNWLPCLVVNLLMAVVVSRIAFLGLTQLIFGVGCCEKQVSWRRIGTMTVVASLWILVMLVMVGSIVYVHWAASLATLAGLVVVACISGRYADWCYVYGDLDFDLPNARTGRSSHGDLAIG